ncbi:MAG: tetratricopeptide repeat protein, partial [Actinobacteria bacterium]|nr:tetratricopeptide repeat protein [Actinomycetota bacterium]
MESGGDASSLACLGTVRRSQGRYAEASELYRRALALDPEHFQAWMGVAMLLTLQGNAASAGTVGRAATAGTGVPAGTAGTAASSASVLGQRYAHNM